MCSDESKDDVNYSTCPTTGGYPNLYFPDGGTTTVTVNPGNLYTGSSTYTYPNVTNEQLMAKMDEIITRISNIEQSIVKIIPMLPDK